jgi:hypothetical protein
LTIGAGKDGAVDVSCEEFFASVVDAFFKNE